MPSSPTNAITRPDLPDLLKAVSVESMDDVHDAAVTIQQLGEEYGFKIALCDDISSREPMSDADGTILNADVFGWVEEGQRWWEKSCLALHSPVVRACRYENQPFWVNKKGFFGHGQNPYVEDIDLKQHFETIQNYNASILIPIHLRFGQISANSINPLDAKQTDLKEEFEAYSEFFNILIRRFISGYVSALTKTRRIPGDCILSKREVECLQWAAVGKTDAEIGTIIRRSHATIRYHIHRAGEKLNSVNRAQTIFKAGQLGFLGASD